MRTRCRGRLASGLFGTLLLVGAGGALVWWFRYAADRPAARAWAEGTDALR
ncbi:MAG: hypothetical protein QM779_13030 [Propionicimonas sp.]|uniref:hypothetical protein n=1 Tax=Propionicimonas sp. TaxID=1955623 RepID=UPI003D11AD85